MTWTSLNLILQGIQQGRHKVLLVHRPLFIFLFFLPSLPRTIDYYSASYRNCPCLTHYTTVQGCKFDISFGRDINSLCKRTQILFFELHAILFLCLSRSLCNVFLAYLNSDLCAESDTWTTVCVLQWLFGKLRRDRKSVV